MPVLKTFDKNTTYIIPHINLLCPVYKQSFFDFYKKKLKNKTALDNELQRTVYYYI